MIHRPQSGSQNRTKNNSQQDFHKLCTVCENLAVNCFWFCSVTHSTVCVSFQTRSVNSERVKIFGTNFQSIAELHTVHKKAKVGTIPNYPMQSACTGVCALFPISCNYSYNQFCIHVLKAPATGVLNLHGLQCLRQSSINLDGWKCIPNYPTLLHTKM